MRVGTDRAFERQCEYRFCLGWKGYTTALSLPRQIVELKGHWDMEEPLWKDILRNVRWGNDCIIVEKL